jgi:nucleotide-binding universal stress UspA family protein
MLHSGVEDLETAERRLMATKPTAEGVDIEHRLVSGEPAKEILRLARDEDVELIVMGTHGRTGVMRALLGSVAEEVLRHATCPVLTVKVPNVVA